MNVWARGKECERERGRVWTSEWMILDWYEGENVEAQQLCGKPLNLMLANGKNEMREYIHIYTYSNI